MAWLAWVWFAATFVPLIWRKRFPVAVIAITGVSTWLYYVTGHWGPLIAAPAIAVLSLRRTRVLEQRSRQVEEERLRIAREVHDVVAHSLAMINVQAGVAAHVADRRPEEAVKALKAIKTASGHALDDLRATLGVLRTGEGTTPVPSLDRLDELVKPVPKARVVGTPGTLPAPVDAAAYRVVQEALTNAMRYASDASEIVISFEHTEDALVLTITDDGGDDGGTGRDQAPQGAGSGIRGMRERVEALGGTLDAGPSAQGFAVRAVLPWEVRGDQSGAGRRPGVGARGFPPAARHRGRVRGRRRGR
ncbi:signal transduction histidine kinase [Saccharothrix ecbatanensis]|uniref:histidine kinase n=1 Tax=Saccharothrix ecbatanensis TaxID=1105145 RepID=A0A7W9M488_9PSEU|nr:histidine kinase [Saccharothrix ecbatanensis]MBB5806860.1 signal transduction histidine kinase [Saccharothrix ecbatanensis]